LKEADRGAALLPLLLLPVAIAPPVVGDAVALCGGCNTKEPEVGSRDEEFDGASPLNECDVGNRGAGVVEPPEEDENDEEGDKPKDAEVCNRRLLPGAAAEPAVAVAAVEGPSTIVGESVKVVETAPPSDVAAAIAGGGGVCRIPLCEESELELSRPRCCCPAAGYSGRMAASAVCAAALAGDVAAPCGEAGAEEEEEETGTEGEGAVGMERGPGEPQTPAAFSRSS